jgi:hypothetical protein
VVRHYSEVSWADFMRNLVPAEERTAMQRHLDGGCEQCGATLQMWREVFSVASGEKAVTPPPDVVHLVKAEFAVAGPVADRKVRLIFDSTLQPATAGVRGSVSARQLLYETDDFCIDLRLQPHREARLTSVIGQVLSRARSSGHSTNAMPVRLCSRDASIAETVTNQFGEFHLEFDHSHDLHLAIGWDLNNAIVLPLYGARPNNTRGVRSGC